METCFRFFKVCFRLLLQLPLLAIYILFFQDLEGFDMNAFTRYFPRAFIPSTPAPEEVNCYMEVETVCRQRTVVYHNKAKNFEQVEW